MKQCDGADGVECPVKTAHSTLSSQLSHSFPSAEEEEEGGEEGEGEETC